jgi:hypothetical protein
MPPVLGRPLLASIRALLLSGREREGEAARRARGGADELLPRGRSIRVRKHRHEPRAGELRLGGRAIRRGEEAQLADWCGEGSGDWEVRRAAGEGGGTACRARRLRHPPPVGEEASGW